MQSRRLFCFGLGYSATALAKEIIKEGGEAFGTCRSLKKISFLKKQGIKAFLFPDASSQNKLLETAKTCTDFIFSIPPDSKGDIALRILGTDLAKLLKEKSVWLGYLSTTGVYGDRDGGWVDETSPCLPTTERGKKRLVAEQAFQQWVQRNHHALSIFRLAGIYGPERNIFLRLKKGVIHLVDKPHQIFSRIHRDDIVAVLSASMQRDRQGVHIYNLCDDNPAPPQDVVCYAAYLLKQNPPPLVPFEQAQLSSMAKSFYSENKRVDNRKIKRELGITLQWPDYKSGLRGLLDSA